MDSSPLLGAPEEEGHGAAVGPRAVRGASDENGDGAGVDLSPALGASEGSGDGTGVDRIKGAWDTPESSKDGAGRGEPQFPGLLMHGHAAADAADSPAPPAADEAADGRAAGTDPPEMPSTVSMAGDGGMGSVLLEETINLDGISSSGGDGNGTSVLEGLQAQVTVIQS